MLTPSLSYKLPAKFLDAIEKNKLAIYGYGFLGRWVWNFLHEHYHYRAPVYDQYEKPSPVGMTSHLAGLKGYEGIVIVCSRHHTVPVGSVFSGMRVSWISADALFVDALLPYRQLIIERISHDDFSVRTFLAIEKILTSGFMCESDHLVGDQYFEPVEFFPTFSESFVDAGAFCGDTLEQFMVKNLGTFTRYHAFEPGEGQFNALTVRAQRLRAEWNLPESKISLHRIGLGRYNGYLDFDDSSLDGMSHAFTKETVHEAGIEIKALDSYLQDSPITFLKSDVEGMDLEFLMGAEQIIRSYRPKLAISCYHYPTDLIEILNYIIQLNLDYRFKLRHHANVIGDYVLYAY
jgi:FkbM family methyltransferase